MTKKEAIELFVSRDLSGIPQEWAKIIAEAKGEEIYAWPMWGTMWLVDDFIGERLMKNAAQVCAPDECENHDKDDTCATCENYEEMGGAFNITGTAAYIYEIDGQYIIGVHGAGWNFYDGVWNNIYDILGLQWHDQENS